MLAARSIRQRRMDGSTRAGIERRASRDGERVIVDQRIERGTGPDAI
jgi:hypothetical protein